MMERTANQRAFLVNGYSSELVELKVRRAADPTAGFLVHIVDMWIDGEPIKNAGIVSLERGLLVARAHYPTPEECVPKVGANTVMEGVAHIADVWTKAKLTRTETNL